MNKFIEAVKKIRFTEKSVPWILLLACVLAFGPLLTNLGYYQDDWNYVFNSYIYGQKGIFDFLDHDGRPFATWVYDLGFFILGYKPIAWHIATLLLRWLTSLIFWLIFKLLWPQRVWQNITAALLFVIYPFFTLQPLAVAYSLHWTGYLLLGISLLFMITAQRKHFWLYTSLAILTQIVHLFTLEYFAGIELLRPIFLWLALPTMTSKHQKRILKTLKQWIPYLLVFLLYFYWRAFIYHAATEGRNDPIGLIGLMQAPLTTITTNLNYVISDVTLILVTSWYKLITPEFLDFHVSENRITLAITILSFGIFLFIFRRLRKQEDPEMESSKRQVLLVGIVSLILGLLPSYAANLIMYQKIEPWNSRFSLGSLFGAALIITVAIEGIVKVPKTRWAIIATLTGLLIGWHIHYTNDFRWAWEKQVDFYRQLYLRAPAILPDTAIITYDEFLMFMGDYPTSYGINLIYETPKESFEGARRANYWFFPFVEFYKNLDKHLKGEPYSEVRAGLVFESDLDGSIAITFKPGMGQCLWVMKPEYINFQALSVPMRKLASISYVDRIQRVQVNQDSFLVKYIFTHPEQDWCYYYQKADLAYQYEEWDDVIKLWKSASEAGLHPDNGFEYLPFIEAYAHKGDWQNAKKMTRISQKTMQGIDSLLCHIWKKLELDAPASPEKEEVISSVKEDLKCEKK